VALPATELYGMALPLTFLRSRPVQARTPGVLQVLAMRQPFEVRGAVISFLPIAMVRLAAFRLGIEERLGDQVV